MRKVLKDWNTRFKAYCKAHDDTWQAELSATQKEEIRAFDQWSREHAWRILGVLLLLWLAGGFGVHHTNPTFPLLPCFLLSAVLLGLVVFACFTAWFGFHKFRSKMLMVIMIALAPLAGILGKAFGVALKSGIGEAWEHLLRMEATTLWWSLGGGVLYAVLVAVIVQYRRKQFEILNRELTAEADRERLARQLADSRLKLLQAQVEPHFLFNTLASIQQLAEGKAPEAARLTGDVITFLRAGLTGFRDEASTLAREFEMADAYLNIMKVRMDKRLSASVVLSDDLARKAMPPAMLISLVENAIKHGVEPAVAGGSVAVNARCEADQLIVSVADTGMGLVSPGVSGGGVGLANIRERLAAIYGKHAQLLVGANTPQGTVAEIVLPLKSAENAGAIN